MTPLNFSFRIASPQDAVTISALSIQVFLNTYATEGVRPDLAREAHSEYSVNAFAQRLAEPQRQFILVETGDGLLGFAEVLLTSVPSPAGDLAGAELVRLYVQPKAQRMNLGRSLLTRAEQLVQAENIGNLWLTAWEGNHNARAFYERLGYADVGATTYTFQGQTYPNRVLAKRFVEATRFAI
jgi:diamine N-acetyltransferase